MYKYTFKEKENILDVSFSGKLDLDEILTYIKELATSENLPRNFKILHDFTQAEYDVKYEDIHTIVREINEGMTRYEFVKVATLHSRPIDTAIATLLMTKVNSRKFAFKIFSNSEEANSWLHSNSY